MGTEHKVCTFGQVALNQQAFASDMLLNDANSERVKSAEGGVISIPQSPICTREKHKISGWDSLLRPTGNEHSAHMNRGANPTVDFVQSSRLRILSILMAPWEQLQHHFQQRRAPRAPPRARISAECEPEIRRSWGLLMGKHLVRRRVD